jgi:hypothetical protein
MVSMLDSCQDALSSAADGWTCKEVSDPVTSSERPCGAARSGARSMVGTCAGTTAAGASASCSAVPRLDALSGLDSDCRTKS